MILVTLGTNDKRFDRLLKAVEDAIRSGAITDRVIAQAGFTKYESDVMEVTDYFDQDTFDRYLEEADLIITHGGAGTILTALKKGKKILGAARLQAYHEHVNDHQKQLLQSFAEQGYLIYMEDLQDIRPYLKKAETFTPRPFVSNTANLIQLIRDWIDHDQETSR